MRYLLICATLALAGCEDMGQIDAGDCSGYGYHPGTQAFAGCMERASSQRDAQWDLIGASMMSRPQRTTCMRIGSTVSCP